MRSFVRGARTSNGLYRMRIENLDWQNLVIFVPDSKTAEGGASFQ
jgi:hypothetical protein